MFLLNLTAAEFLALLGGLGGLITTLYLLDRTRRKKIVSTLRFWNPAFSAEQQQKRKRVREPWSLILQLASLLLLLLAIAQLEWGTRNRPGHDHVILLDTSSSTAQIEAEATLLDREKSTARQVLASLPASDRIMLVRVDALAVPATSFTSDREQLVRAIRESTSSFSALNIAQALSFARQARAWSGGEGGEIVYVGPRLVEDALPESDAALNPAGLRVISLASTTENRGIRSITVKRGDDSTNSWQATVTLKQYGSEPHGVHLNAQFAGTRFAPRGLILRAGQEIAVQYNFVTNTAGIFSVAITPRDSLPADDQASLALPASGILRVAAFTNRPQVLRPLLEANRRLSVKFFAPESYSSRLQADVILLDQFAPVEGAASSPGALSQPRLPSLWIDPPKQGSPLPVKAVMSNVAIKSWHSDVLAGVGLHATEDRFARAHVFETFEGDQTVGSIPEGPVVVVRAADGKHGKQAVIGLDPLSGAMRFKVTTPLLFANLFRWLAPEAFRTVEVSAGRVGTASVVLDNNESASGLRATDERGFAVPFTIRDHSLELFTSRPSVLRVVSAEREHVLSLTLPEMAQVEWKPPQNASTGVPSPPTIAPTAVDLWRWLAILGGFGLLAEWLLFGNRRIAKWGTVLPSHRRPLSSAQTRGPAPKRELVSK